MVLPPDLLGWWEDNLGFREAAWSFGHWGVSGPLVKGLRVKVWCCCVVSLTASVCIWGFPCFYFSVFLK